MMILYNKYRVILIIDAAFLFCIYYQELKMRCILHITLSDVATMQAGQTKLGTLKLNDGGNLFAVRVQDIGQDLNIESLIKIQNDNIDANHYLQSGDILVRARGKDFKCSVVQNVTTLPMIAISPIIIVRVKPDLVLPEYLAYEINRNKSQAWLNNEAMGTYMPSINNQSLGRLPVSIPPIALQHIIVNILKSKSKEQLLVTRLTQLRHKLIQAQIKQRIQHYAK